MPNAILKFHITTTNFSYSHHHPNLLPKSPLKFHITIIIITNLSISRIPHSLTFHHNPLFSLCSLIVTTSPFPSIHLTHLHFPTTHLHRHRHHHYLPPPPSAANPTTFSSPKPIINEEGPNDILSLQNRRYDFTPLLRFLSDKTLSLSNLNNSSSPTSLDSTEFQLAESYRAVPAPLWHALLKSLCSDSDSDSDSAMSEMKKKHREQLLGFITRNMKMKKHGERKKKRCFRV